MSAFLLSLRKISFFIATKTQYAGVMQTFRAQCIATLGNLIGNTKPTATSIYFDHNVLENFFLI